MVTHMQLYNNWKTILAKAWSIRFMAMSFVSSTALVIFTAAPDLIPKSWLTTIIIAILIGLFNVLSIWARVTYQRNLTDDNK